ncbi:MAG: hypothetical protein HXL33_06005 [Prevotellaceae bacterium]|nr:hypothetical protein [Prevotellaceae bacterium]
MALCNKAHRSAAVSSAYGDRRTHGVAAVNSTADGHHTTNTTPKHRNCCILNIPSIRNIDKNMMMYSQIP